MAMTCSSWCDGGASSPRQAPRDVILLPPSVGKLSVEAVAPAPCTVLEGDARSGYPHADSTAGAPVRKGGSPSSCRVRAVVRAHDFAR